LHSHQKVLQVKFTVFILLQVFPFRGLVVLKTSYSNRNVIYEKNVWHNKLRETIRNRHQHAVNRFVVHNILDRSVELTSVNCTILISVYLFKMLPEKFSVAGTCWFIIFGGHCRLSKSEPNNCTAFVVSSQQIAKLFVVCDCVISKTECHMLSKLKFWLQALLLVTIFSAAFSLRNDGSRWIFDNLIDSNHDGVLTINEIAKYVCRYSQKDTEHAYSSCLSQRQARIMMEQLDNDRSGTISWEEFRRKYRPYPIEGAPQQVHLAVTTIPSEMVVMWVTRDKLPSVVEYGLLPDILMNTAVGTAATYTAGIDGWRGWIHTVKLTGLSPRTRYFYRVGSKDNWSQTFSFISSPPNSNNRDESLNIAVVADMGTVIPMGWAVTDQMVRQNKIRRIDLTLHIGDVCYAGTGSTWEIEEIWDLWGNQIEPLAAYTPYMFAVGNHEKYYNFSAYRARFQMPGPQSGGNGNFWWSIDYGNTHFTFMSTEHPYHPGTPQYSWLKQDLAKANANRRNTPWLILSGHRPMYSSDVDEWDSHRPGSYFQMVIEPLMKEYNVDLYLCGHMHMYERVYPVLNGTVLARGNYFVNPKGPPHVNQATGGVFTDLSYIEPRPDWSAIRNDYWGYGQLEIHNSTHLHYSFVHWDSGLPVDEFWIQKT
jgi:predicted MPP superfamily phosphohydrolase